MEVLENIGHLYEIVVKNSQEYVLEGNIRITCSW